MIPLAEKGAFRITRRDGRTYLHEGTHHWMDDSVPERRTQDFVVEIVTGKVLIGGLGLGCILEQLQAKDAVTKMIVIEKAQEVIDLVWPHLDVPKATIVHKDLEVYLKTTDETFDYIYMDVWPKRKHVSIPDWRALAEKLVTPDRVLCWGE